jgi:hypothetical protein
LAVGITDDSADGRADDGTLVGRALGFEFVLAGVAVGIGVEGLEVGLGPFGGTVGEVVGIGVGNVAGGFVGPVGATVGNEDGAMNEVVTKQAPDEPVTPDVVPHVEVPVVQPIAISQTEDIHEVVDPDKHP